MLLLSYCKRIFAYFYAQSGLYDLYKMFLLLFVYLRLYQIVYDVRVNEHADNYYHIVINKFYIVNNDHSIDKLKEVIDTNVSHVSFNYLSKRFEIYTTDFIVKIDGQRQEIELGDISLDGLLLVNNYNAR